MWKPIVIKIKKITYDEIKNPITTYEEYHRCKAKINCVGGKEYYAAKQINAENDVTFEVRYCKLLASLNSLDYVIVFNNITYDIISIDNFMLRNETLKIRTVASNGR